MRVLELFAGAGLATEGLLAAGLDVVRAVEWDRDADATARTAGHASLCGDVRWSWVYEDLGTFNGGPDRASDAAFLGAGIRRLTVQECARLQGVRADYPWHGTKTAQYRQVGNGVPPDLSQALATAVQAANRSTQKRTA